jgi:hypothetical protein
MNMTRKLGLLVLIVLLAGTTRLDTYAADDAKSKAEIKRELKKKALLEAKAKAEAEAKAKAKAEADAKAKQAKPAYDSKPNPAVKSLPKASPESLEEISKKIDSLIMKQLQTAKQSLGEQCTDSDFLRRAYLDITGVIPSLSDAKKFLDSTEADKRAKLIEQLLGSPNYGRHETDLWQAKLLPRDSNARFVLRDPFIEWLTSEFNKNTPWDQMIAKLVGASGSVDKNPEVTYFLVNRSVDKLTDSVGQHFLGLQIACAQCHNHPFTSWKQTDYWGLAEFFSKVNPSNAKNPNKGGDNSKIGVNEGVNRSKVKDFFPESEKTVPPKFLGGEQPKLTSSEPYRPVLVKWLTSANNPYFAKAAVNRIWAQYFGHGIIDPVDDLDGQEPSHPELMDYLTQQFVAHGFDQKFLIKAICNTQAYQRSSKPVKGQTSEDEKELFARMTMKVMTPEQLYDSLAQVSGATERAVKEKKGAGAPKGQPNDPRDRFVQFFLAGAEKPNTAEYEAGIPQALKLMNSRIVGNPAALRSIVSPGTKPAQAIEAIWLAALSRRPSEAELKTFTEYTTKNGNSMDAYTDLFWAVLNSSEFTLIR